MIQHVRTVGFKGFDIDEDVPLKAIYNGRNMSGKSARAAAMALAVYGHIPFSTAGKRPGDILESFGGESLVVSVTINGTEFARKFARDAKGTVKQSVQMDRKKASKENFAILLNKSGAPRIADIAEFMKQSEAKKVDTLFDLFPNPELASIDTEIEEAKADVSNLEKKKAGAEATVQRLTNSKQKIELPAGSIAEVQDEINKTETQIVELEEEIKQAEIEEAKVQAAEQAKKEEAERIENERLEAERKAQEEQSDEPSITDEQLDSMPDSPEMEQLDKTITGMEQQFEDFQSGNSQAFARIPSAPIESIQKIIDALKGAGCGTCAALIVAKQELKKYKEVS